MRTLHAGLTTAQQAASGTPYVLVSATDGVDTYNYDTAASGGASKRVVSVHHWEEPYGGMATIRLDNSDQNFKTLNLRGFAVTLSWGFLCAGPAYRTSSVQPLWVVSQRDISVEGKLLTELICYDKWAYLANSFLIAAGVELVGTVVNPKNFTIGETITGDSSGATGKLSSVTATSISVIDVTGTFITTEDADGASISCGSLTAVTAKSAAGGGEWNKDTSILNILKAITSSVLTDVILDEDDSDTNMQDQPLVMVPTGARVRWLIRQLLQMTKCGARIEDDDKLHVLYLDGAAGAQYTFDGSHSFWTDIREQGVILPNKVLFVDQLPTVDGIVATYFGVAADAGSESLIGTFLTIEVDPTITSDAEAVNKGMTWIHQRKSEINQGQVSVPMECGLEIYDMIGVTDTRADITVKVRAGRLDRFYESGRYELIIQLGGLMHTPGAVPSNTDSIASDMGDMSAGTPKDPPVSATPGRDNIQHGTDTTDGSGLKTITFSPAFSAVPDVIVSIRGQVGTNVPIITVTALSSSSFTVRTRQAGGVATGGNSDNTGTGGPTITGAESAHTHSQVTGSQQTGITDAHQHGYNDASGQTTIGGSSHTHSIGNPHSHSMQGHTHTTPTGHSALASCDFCWVAME